MPEQAARDNTLVLAPAAMTIAAPLLLGNAQVLGRVGRKVLIQGLSPLSTLTPLSTHRALVGDCRVQVVLPARLIHADALRNL